jgi:hypothetical protein
LRGERADPCKGLSTRLQARQQRFAKRCLRDGRTLHAGGSPRRLDAARPRPAAGGGSPPRRARASFSRCSGSGRTRSVPPASASG